MKSATLIFPHQLFKDHPALSKEREVFLVEDPLFFTGSSFSLRFHKKKLMLHRASMKAYEKRLGSQGYLVQYIDFETDLFWTLDRKKIRVIWFADPVDRALQSRLAEEAGKGKVDLHRHPTPAFLTPEDWLLGFFKESRHFSMTHFYIAQRKRLNVLLDGDKPRGEKWSFDPENRKRVPKGLPVPRPPACKPNLFTKEAKTYVENHFPANPGTTEKFFYPVTHENSEQWLEHFLKEKLQNFGDYEDAILKDEPFLFHSVLTPMLNIGLLTPDQILKKALDVGEKNKMPLNSLEGFVRQVIGWREFMRAVYLMKGKEERTTNYFHHQRKLPKSFYAGTTGLDPVDTVIGRVLQHAYVHHIERLMILGNIMVLCEIDPDEVYRWFMELFIDAYDWVMVPNVYGMSQYADGGLIMTKPYISSSNYIRKMSDFRDGPWCEIWDGLYWRFIRKHRDLFSKNPRMKVMVNQLDRMGKERLKHHLLVAEKFFEGF
jgi:deoxyribodipyrimidine photolyase-related protein